MLRQLLNQKQILINPKSITAREMMKDLNRVKQCIIFKVSEKAWYNVSRGPRIELNQMVFEKKPIALEGINHLIQISTCFSKYQR